ncbi:hypothetical protein Poli38472_007744 [Pythium oligandrum]|uniref:VPS9 domain-containing protein n=1 Tax=Pythium oligandrum TaxID=41045 RepID=A0A8K1FQL5_PYTOL|nr:hypothetical protein Poli38472_007744 [Pythium oligandrum]|eukprot:TMW68072.1 hypothetical protein Poli38472_007744 [Pythium oligandrum]
MTMFRRRRASTMRMSCPDFTAAVGREDDGTEEEEQLSRASCPSFSHVNARGSWLERREQDLLDAWASLFQSSRFSPSFILRVQRRISQSFNLKVVQAFQKVSLRRHSVSGTTPDAQEDSSGAVNALSLSEKLSLSVGRRVSRDFVPILTDGTPLECRVRELVYGLLHDHQGFEAHACQQFFVKMESFRGTSPDASRYYLMRVRDTIRDLVAFILEYRRPQLQVFLTHEHNDDEISLAVQYAVEEYFCFSTRIQLQTWARIAAEVEHQTRFYRKLRRLPASSSALVTNAPPDHPLLLRAIDKLRDIGTLVIPSRKMASLVDACHSLSEFITQQSQTAQLQRKTSTSDAQSLYADADAFLPLLIVAVARSQLREPFLNCAFLAGLYPFSYQFGERRFYLTMLEAALEFLRTRS